MQAPDMDGPQGLPPTDRAPGPRAPRAAVSAPVAREKPATVHPAAPGLGGVVSALHGD